MFVLFWIRTLVLRYRNGELRVSYRGVWVKDGRDLPNESTQGRRKGVHRPWTQVMLVCAVDRGIHPSFPAAPQLRCNNHIRIIFTEPTEVHRKQNGGPVFCTIHNSTRKEMETDRLSWVEWSGGYPWLSMSGEGHVIHLLNANSFKSALQSGYVFSSNSISSDAYTFADIYIYCIFLVDGPWRWSTCWWWW